MVDGPIREFFRVECKSPFEENIIGLQKDY